MRKIILSASWLTLIAAPTFIYAAEQPAVCKALSQQLDAIYLNPTSTANQLILASDAELNENNTLTITPPFIYPDLIWANWTLASQKETTPKSLHFFIDNVQDSNKIQLMIDSFEWWRGLTYQYQHSMGNPLNGDLYQGQTFGWFERDFWNVFYFQQHPFIVETSGLYQPINVYALHNGDSKKICQVMPTIPVNVAKNDLDLAYQHAAKFFMTEFNGDFGTMGSPYIPYHYNTMLDILYRPFAHLSQNTQTQKVDSLEYVKLSDAWSARESDAAKNIASINKAYLNDYFSKQFSPNNTKQLSSLVLEEVYSDYNRKALEPNALSHLKQLNQALSTNNAENIIKSCQVFATSKSFDYYHDNQATLTDCLSLALDNPTVIKALIQQCKESKETCLLTQVNTFGKNLLMYAAHMNNLKAVSLLANSALLNTVTKGTSDTGFPLADNQTTSGRTPLMYAAENASKPIIQALLDARVNQTLKDSNGKDYLDYMEKNWRFNSGKARAYFNQSGPSFHCAKAKSKREKVICSSEMLSVYDKELSYLYKEIYNQSPNVKALQYNQREWLANLDKICSDNSQYSQCLARQYRGRIRAFEFIAFRGSH